MKFQILINYDRKDIVKIMVTCIFVVNFCINEFIYKDSHITALMTFQCGTTVNDRLSPWGLICQNDFMGSIFKV